jgi:surface protein
MKVQTLLSIVDGYEPDIYEEIQELLLFFQPQNHEELKEAVVLWCDNREEGFEKYGHISLWNTSKITDMSYLFPYNFNDNINNWDVSNVANMQSMFGNCKSFNQSLNNWDVSNVINMNCMFESCHNFDQPLNDWNVLKVTNMNSMFINCVRFNQPLNNWKVSNVKTMCNMFSFCGKFCPQTIQYWDINKSTNISYMTYNCNLQI